MTVWSLISKFLIFFNGYEKINQCVIVAWLPGDFVSMKKCWICMNKAWISSIVRGDGLREHPFFRLLFTRRDDWRPEIRLWLVCQMKNRKSSFISAWACSWIACGWSEDTSDKWKSTPVLIKREQVCQDRKCLTCEKILREKEKSTF